MAPKSRVSRFDDKFVEAYAKDFNRQFNTAPTPLDAMKKAFELVDAAPKVRESRFRRRLPTAGAGRSRGNGQHRCRKVAAAGCLGRVLKFLYRA